MEHLFPGDRTSIAVSRLQALCGFHMPNQAIPPWSYFWTVRTHIRLTLDHLHLIFRRRQAHIIFAVTVLILLSSDPVSVLPASFFLSPAICSFVLVLLPRLASFRSCYFCSNLDDIE